MATTVETYKQEIKDLKASRNFWRELATANANTLHCMADTMSLMQETIDSYKSKLQEAKNEKRGQIEFISLPKIQLELYTESGEKVYSRIVKEESTERQG